jgi:nitrogen-specific signal transduction histidine kinase
VNGSADAQFPGPLESAPDAVVEGRSAPEQQSQRLESLGQLAGGIAHDFNNLLAVILNYASFIDEEVGAAVGEPDGKRWLGVKGDVEQVLQAAERATQLTRQLLAFARRDVVRPQVLNLNSVVTDVEQLLRRTIGEHLELVISLAEDLQPVYADRGQIEQVLMNLAVNARDAMEQGGILTIDTKNVEADADSDLAASRPGSGARRYAGLRVSDTGTGLDKATLERAFEPFFTTKPKGAGSGLGLATVYGIVAQAGGDVRIFSQPGIGTTVRVLFPVTDAEAESGPHAPTAVRTRGGETILVVEDEAAMREVTRRILARNDHDVLVAGSGAEAIEIIRAHPGEVSLLVTDVVMPQMLGKEVAEQIKELRPGIRVLFMSGYAQPVLASKGTLEAGVVLIEKPFTEKGLLAKVREVLDAPMSPS